MKTLLAIILHQQNNNDEYEKDNYFIWATISNELHCFCRTTWNYEVLSVDQITNKLSNKKSKGGETLSEVILNLEKEGLLYCNNNQTEIVTVLDIHKTIILGQYGANLNSSYE